ncbi:hypothetical protein ACIPY6_02895 [Streptomyces sp. NPDC090054]|uniref:hypothetical protein n=1 Tax=Streptomyces sp. NPDC090054 TaxID=3365933 RepID=UPI0037FB9154
MAPEEPESPPVPPAPPPARYRIAAPGPVSGGVMGVGFANGHAVITDPVRHARALAWFRAEPGYSVEQIDPRTPEPASVPPEERFEAAPATDEMSVPEPASEPTPRRRK